MRQKTKRFAKCEQKREKSKRARSKVYLINVTRHVTSDDSIENEKLKLRNLYDVVKTQYPTYTHLAASIQTHLSEASERITMCSAKQFSREFSSVIERFFCSLFFAFTRSIRVFKSSKAFHIFSSSLQIVVKNNIHDNVTVRRENE